MIDRRTPMDVSRAALEVAELGIPVLPTTADGTPMLRNGAYAASTDEATIERWVQHWPGANWAAHTANLLIADADSPQHAPDGNGPDGRVAWAKLAIGGHEPTIRTPTWGEHHWFRLPSGVSVPSRAGGIAPAVDVISGWGLCIPLPGSETERGRYVTVRPITAGMPAAPAELIRLASRRRTQTTHTLGILPQITIEGTLQRLRRAEPGTRNDSLNLAAYLLGRMIASGRAERQDVERLLIETGQALGLGNKETQKTVESGLRAGIEAKGALPINEHQERAYGVLRWAMERPCLGRTGVTDRHITIAHALIALRVGQPTYDADVRTLAELAGVSSAKTVSNANKRLVAEGVIRLVHSSGRYGFRPSEWTLLRQVDTHTQETVTVAETEGDAPALTLMGVCVSLTQHHDVWRCNGLGGAAHIVYDTLQRFGPGRVTDIAERIGGPRKRRSVERALKKLARVVDVATGETASLVAKSGKNWTALPTDLDTIAKLLHVDGEAERQHARHEREREQHSRSWQEERTRRALGTLPERQTTTAEKELAL